MTSAHALELTKKLLEDSTTATPLLQLLYAFANSKDDPLSEAMRRDVMLYVWTKIENCEEAMTKFLKQQEISPTKKAA